MIGIITQNSAIWKQWENNAKLFKTWHSIARRNFAIWSSILRQSVPFLSLIAPDYWDDSPIAKFVIFKKFFRKSTLLKTEFCLMIDIKSAPWWLSRGGDGGIPSILAMRKMTTKSSPPRWCIWHIRGLRCALCPWYIDFSGKTAGLGLIYLYLRKPTNLCMSRT